MTQNMDGLMRRFGSRCMWCNIIVVNADHTAVYRASLATREHLTPKSRGGTKKVANMGLACAPCNEAKGDQTEREFRSFLATGKLHPEYIEWLAKTMSKKLPPAVRTQHVRHRENVA